MPKIRDIDIQSRTNQFFEKLYSNKQRIIGFRNFNYFQ